MFDLNCIYAFLLLQTCLLSDLVSLFSGIPTVSPVNVSVSSRFSGVNVGHFADNVERVPSPSYRRMSLTDSMPLCHSACIPDPSPMTQTRETDRLGWQVDVLAKPRITQGLDDHCHRPTLERIDRRRGTAECFYSKKV